MGEKVQGKFVYTAGFALGLGKRTAPATTASTYVAAFNAAVAQQLSAATAIAASPINIIKQARSEPEVDAQTKEDAPDQQPVSNDEVGAAVQSDFIAISASNTVPTASPVPVQASAAASLADIEVIGKQPYWMQRCKGIQSPFLRLHQEMVELSELLQPAPEEVAARRAAVAEVAGVVNSIWPSAQVAVFGSFATGLFVPTSDIDLVVTDSRCANIPDGLKALATALARKNVATGIQVIGRARVPIIKFETTGHGGLAFDVSFDVANGPQAAELVQEFVQVWPMMRPLVLILKLFLQQRELNEVYSGGIGSYGLITMVAAFLQLHNSRRPSQSSSSGGPGRPHSGTSSGSAKKRAGASGNKTQKCPYLEASLGVLLVDFFRTFGRVMNMHEVGLSCASGGCFFPKADKDGADWTNSERPYMLAVEDPKDPSNDICRSSFNIMRVKAAFDFAYQQLTAPCNASDSLLARILRLGAILVSRKPCPNPTLLYQDLHNCRAKPAVVPNSQHVEQPSGRAELPSKPGKRTTMREWEPSPEPDKRARLT